MPRGQRGSAKPHPWSNSYSYTADGPRAPDCGNVLRSLKQDAFPVMCAMDEAEAERALRDLGFLPPTKHRHCYRCGAALSITTPKEGPQMLRCSTRGCSAKFNAHRAYTPLHLTTTTYKEYLLAVYAFSLLLRVDQAAHMTGVNIKKIGIYFACCRDVCAWYPIACRPVLPPPIIVASGAQARAVCPKVRVGLLRLVHVLIVQ